MKRRDFLKGASACLSTALIPRFSKALDQTGHPDKLTEQIQSLFQSDDPKVITLTENIFRNCVVNKIFPATAPLPYNWISPGGHYRGQWIWDTMFVVDMLSILPSQEKVIRDVFRNYWDFQDRWNKVMPEYAHDMIACMIQPGKTQKRWRTFPAYSQIPILAWGVERVYKRNNDKKLLEESLPRLERFHDWYWRERDVSDVGLIAVGAYSGKIQHGRYETFDFDRSLDDLKFTPHPKRKGSSERPWYGDVLVVGNTSYLIMAEQSLVKLARIMGDEPMVKRRQIRIDKAVEAVRKHMWDDKEGTFLAVHRDTMQKIPGKSIGSWLPLIAAIPTRKMAKRMADNLASPDWNTPLPVTTMCKSDPKWTSSGFWRGDVWPPANYQVASGLASYGHKDLAGLIADKTVANAIKHGVSEHYDSVTGKPLGVNYLGMSCTIITMMLDNLTQKHKLELKQAKT